MTLQKLALVLVTLTFAFACLSLWAMLDAVATLSPHWKNPVPAFTQLWVDWRSGLLILPVPVLLSAVLLRGRLQRDPGASSLFVAGSMATFCLIFFPVLLALLLPFFRVLEG